MKKTVMIFVSIFILVTTSGCTDGGVYRLADYIEINDLTYSSSEISTTEFETDTDLPNETEVEAVSMEVTEEVTTETESVTEPETESTTELTTTLPIPEVSTEYKVKSGDTVFKIAMQYGITVDEIIAYNGLDSNGTIYVDQTLILPGVDALVSEEDDQNSNNEVTDDYVCNNSVTLCTTGANEDSWYNIELASSYLNGMTLGPGESFSWANYMGPNDTSQGYREAGVYSAGQPATAPGGGVCFVSTTLMQSARGAGCIITEKHDHSLPVSYASPGDEASVSWGTWDLRFYNPSNTATLTFYVTTNSADRSCTISCSVT